MADESMVRNLAAQAEAIWPQEQPLFARYHLPRDANVLDAGCGTGEISVRIGEMLARARVLGVDIIDAHLDAASAEVHGSAIASASRTAASSISACRTASSISSSAGTCSRLFRMPIAR